MASERLQGDQKLYSKSYVFGNTSFPCLNAFKKCTTRTELFKGKRYIKNL